MRRVYQIAETRDRKALTEFLVREGQCLLPFVELIAGEYVPAAVEGCGGSREFASYATFTC